MIEFAWPWLSLMLLLPPIIWFLVPGKKPNSGSALRVPQLAGFESLEVSLHKNTRFNKNYRFLTLIFVLLVIAAVRPQWLGDPLDLPTSGRDLMLGVDISGSMREQDFRYSGRVVSRLSVVKQLGSQFIERRSGDRIGLILFGAKAYVQTPLTYDRQTVQRFLGEAVVGLAGKATAIGDAIGLSIKRLRSRPQESRVLILLTDGANTAGEVEPLEAAKQAKKLGIKIYTIGVGADPGASGQLFSFAFGSRQSDLDEKALTRIAEKTGGRYFRARNTSEMEEIYNLINQLEPTEGKGEPLRPLKELFIWPLGTAFILGLGLLFWRLRGIVR